MNSGRLTVKFAGLGISQSVGVINLPIQNALRVSAGSRAHRSLAPPIYTLRPDHARPGEAHSALSFSKIRAFLSHSPLPSIYTARSVCPHDVAECARAVRSSLPRPPRAGPSNAVSHNTKMAAERSSSPRDGRLAAVHVNFVSASRGLTACGAKLVAGDGSSSRSPTNRRSRRLR